jgi:sodium/potassium/calcium exchanger 6
VLWTFLFLRISVSAAQNATHNSSRTFHFPITKFEEDDGYEDENHDKNNHEGFSTPIDPFNNKTFEAQDCHSIHLVASQDQCQFSLDHCEEYTLGFINYLNFYYCHVNLKAFSVIAYIAFLVMLFTALGLTASEFLCPNLDSISKIFKMSESLTGVTLLALGNGSPDLFGTLEAVKANSTSLAVGELIGAALFITCCVVGSMSIVRPFKVAKKPFVRDVSFLLIGLTITVMLLKDGEISVANGIAMVVLYALYVLFVVLWDYFMVRKRKRELLDRKIRNAYLNDEVLSFSSNYTPFTVEENNELNDDEILDSLRITNNDYTDSGIGYINSQFKDQSDKNFQDWNANSLKLLKSKIRPSLYTAIELNNQNNQLSAGNGKDTISLDTMETTPGLLNSTKIKMSSAPVFRDIESSADDDLGNYESRTSSHSAPAALYHDDEERYRDDPELDEDDMTDPGTPVLGYDGQVDQLNTPIFSNVRNFLDVKVNLLLILFPSLDGFSKSSMLNKVFILICLPLITILRATIPVVETMIIPGSITFKKSIDLRSMWVDNFSLLLLQCLISPFITSFLLFESHSLLLSSLLSLSLLSLSIFIKSNFNSNNLSSMVYLTTVILSIIGFIISISWISTIATEIISLIKFFSILFNLSDPILGLTVFAVGNSLGDLISNFTIAKMGFPMMAMSACFGGPLLNILLGIGISVNYVLLTTDVNVITFEVSRTLIISCSTLFVNLLWLLVMVPLNKWEMNARIGYVMIGLWSVATVVCVLLEIIS